MNKTCEKSSHTYSLYGKFSRLGICPQNTITPKLEQVFVEVHDLHYKIFTFVIVLYNY